MNILIALIFTFLMTSHAQNPGCVFLEGLGLPCFQDGSQCNTCASAYSEAQMQAACVGDLPLNNPSGCQQNVTCGKKCCTKCSDHNPANYYTCQDLPSACDGNGNAVSCGKGTKVPSCDDASCTADAQKNCGEFSCTPCGIKCEGKVQKINCYTWTTQSYQAGSCSCQSSGSCSGAPTGASECGGSTNPCSGSGSSCSGQSNRCWTCQYTSSGGAQPTCNSFSGKCYDQPTQAMVCPNFDFDTKTYTNSCPSGFFDSPSSPPGIRCSEAPAPQCTSNSQCSCN